MMDRVAIICANGIGDALLMMIAAYAYKKSGHSVTVFHDHANDLKLLFPDFHFEKQIIPSFLKETLSPFDLVIVENDHSERAWSLFRLRKEKDLSNTIFFFPSPSIAQTADDILFDPHISIATNIAKACSTLLDLNSISKDNGLFLSPFHHYRKHKNRIVIHPTSLNKKKNWLAKQFLRLAKQLRKENFSISFAVAPNERESWKYVIDRGFFLPEFVTLRDLADYIFESGFFIGNDSALGHLASNLNIPTLTIAGNPKQITLWRPSWHKGEVVTPPFSLPNLKGIHLQLRDRFWPYFVPVPKVYQAFQKFYQEAGG